MPEDRLIDPSWLKKARKDRKNFAIRTLLVFGVLSVLAWWALPRLEAQHDEITRSLVLKKKDPNSAAPSTVRILAASAGVFKAFWVVIAIGCGAGILLAFTGKIDTLLPVLNIAVLLAGAAALALTFYVFYAPTLIVLESLK